MPSPTIESLHINAPLTNISIAYRNDAYVADQVFPLVPVNKQSDIYVKYTQDDWFRDEAQRRAPGEAVKTSGWNVDTSNTFYCINYALGKVIPDEVARNADSIFNLDREAALFVTDKLQLRREIEWVADFFTTSIWTTDITGASSVSTNQVVYWDTYASSNPIQDVHDGVETILGDTGKMANTLVMGYEVFNELQDHPDFLDRIKYTQRGVVTREIMANVFGIDRVLVAHAIKATNLELDTEAYSFVWGKNVLLAYVAPRPALMEPSAGYTFVWDGGHGAGGPQIINQYHDDRLHSDVVEALGWWDTVRTAQNCGYFFSGIVS